MGRYCNYFRVCVGHVDKRGPVHGCLARVNVTLHGNVGKSDRVVGTGPGIWCSVVAQVQLLIQVYLGTLRPVPTKTFMVWDIKNKYILSDAVLFRPFQHFFYCIGIIIDLKRHLWSPLRRLINPLLMCFFRTTSLTFATQPPWRQHRSIWRRSRLKYCCRRGRSTF